MWFVRLLAIVAVIAVGVGFVAYAVSGDRRFLAFSWRIARWGLLFVLIFFGLLVVERFGLVAIAW